MKKIERIKEKIRTDCGCSDCSCFNKKVARIKKYYSAGIPMEYWDYSFKNFRGSPVLKNKFSKYLGDIDETYDNGSSIFLAGTMGTGKTYASCCLLKLAIVKGYRCKYVNMIDIITNIISNNDINTGEYLSTLINVDFLVVDEMDSRWIFPSEKTEQIFGSYMEHILRSRFQNKMPTVLCSNTTDISDIFHLPAMTLN